MGDAGKNLIAMYERQIEKPSWRWILAPVGGATLGVVQSVSLAFWLGLGPFRLAPQLLGSGLALPFAIAGLVGAASALFRLNFKVAIVGALLSLFSVGPLGSGFLGSLVAIGMILGAGDHTFRQ